MSVATAAEKERRMQAIPHGGHLVDRCVTHSRRIAVITEEAERAPSVVLDVRGLSDLEMIATGAFSPLQGFMGRQDYQAVVETARLASGLPWPIPVTLPVTREEAVSCEVGGALALRDPAGTLFGLLRVEDVYEADLGHEARLVYRTTDSRHPGVAYLEGRGTVRVGGAVELVRRPEHAGFEDVLLDPKETRLLFRARGWRTVVAFQTRNPVHRAHEYIQKCALEIVDGLLLHPLVGATKDDDVPAPVRLQCYRAILAARFPKDRAVLSVFPGAMRYAGPREAVFHALVRKNYGCTHMIVGRDHAGVGDFYGTFDAHRIFDEFEPEELGITPLFFDHAFYCPHCEGMASPKTCPHEATARLTLSGTAVRRLLEAGQLPPREFTRAEVAAILHEEYTRNGRGDAVEVVG